MAPSGGGSDFRLGSSLCDFCTAWVEGGLSITVGTGILKTRRHSGSGPERCSGSNESWWLLRPDLTEWRKDPAPKLRHPSDAPLLRHLALSRLHQDVVLGCVKVEQSARVAGHGHPSPPQERVVVSENGSLVSMERSTSIVAAGLLSGALGCRNARQGRQPKGHRKTRVPKPWRVPYRREVSGKSQSDFPRRLGRVIAAEAIVGC